MSTLQPNRALLFLSAAFIPWIILGVRFGSMSVYLAFIFAFFDIKYWAKFGARAIAFLPSFWFILLVTGALIFVLRAQDGLIALGKISVGICYTAYLKDGFRNHGTSGLRCGLGAAVGLAIIQFIEANIYHTTFLATRPLAAKLVSTIPIFVLYDQGVSYAQGLFGSIIRVSGSAPEPGYFSSILTALIPIFIIKNRRWLLVIFVGLLVSLSKVTLLQLALMPWCYIAAIILPLGLALPLLFSAFAIAAWDLIPRASQLAQLYISGRTYFDRIFPIFVFKDLTLLDQLFGIGYSHGCRPPEGFSFIFAPETIAKFRSFFYEGDCMTFGFSSIGSFLVENGAIGLIFITLFLKLFRARGEASTTEVNGVRRLRIITDFCCLQFFVANMSVHYLTQFPAFFAVLAYGFSICNNCGVPNIKHAKNFWLPNKPPVRSRA